MTDPALITAPDLPYAKGHGTENDFVIIEDLDGSMDITAAQVRALCDRHAGIGADGILRIAPEAGGGWFMDHRNADGSTAMMCGNGARLFARYLVDRGLVPAGDVTFGTRSGPRTATVLPDGRVRLTMGTVALGVASEATVDGVTFTGVAADVGNPHLVCETEIPVAALDLGSQPGFDPVVFPDGVNIEFVNRLASDEVRMRVHERGVGETRSCGTGTVAVAAAHLAATGRSAGTVIVHVLGGRIDVDITVDPAQVMTGAITGPAQVVARGVVVGRWWADQRG